MDIPTKDQILAFAEIVNKTREEFGIPPVETWNVTRSRPGSSRGCLSARHLLGPIVLGEKVDAIPLESGYGSVGMGAFSTEPALQDQLAQALGTHVGRDESEQYGVLIPEEILAVTNPFDALADDDSAWDGEDLRDAFVEAGLDAS